MSQAVKYIVLGVCISIALSLAGALINQLYPIEIVNNFGISLNNFINSASVFIGNVRACFNYILGSHLPLTIAISFWIIVPFARVALKVVIMVLRWFGQ